eukprot:7327033-Alexandrium_andersonii.AAC.1
MCGRVSTTHFFEAVEVAAIPDPGALAGVGGCRRRAAGRVGSSLSPCGVLRHVPDCQIALPF